MAMNPQNVLSSLRMMSDQQLQQYAAMHKNDPFIFPLAFQESQTRKQMRAESQQAQMAPQPKVADQALASMAAEPMPEEVGIGALPAQNLEGMAAGGIVAFDEGGEVPRYQAGGRPVYPGMLPMEGGTVLPTTSGFEGMGMGDFFSSLSEKAKRAWLNMTSEEREKANAQAMYAGKKPPTMQMGSNLGATDASLGAAGVAALAAADKGAPGAGGAGSSGAGGAAPTAGTGPRPAGGAVLPGAMPPGLTQTAAGTMQELQNMRAQLGQPAVPQAQLDAIEKFRAAKEASGKEGLAALEADIAAQGKGMEGAEARAQARAEKLTKREGDLAGMAMFEAGMAMMSGESPFALVNIGKGANIGMKSYTAGLEKLQEARDKLDESFDKIEQFRMNRADMNAKEVRAAKADIRSTKVEAEKLGLDALMKEGDMNRADARAAFDSMQRNRATMYEVGSRERLGLAQIQAHKDIAASQPDRALWDSLLKQNNNDPAAAYQALTKLKTEKFNPYQSYADYLKAFAGKETLTPPLSFTQYAQQFNVPSYTGSSLPDNATTRGPLK